MAVAPLVMLGTATGTLLSVKVVSPSCPEVFFPQQNTAPLAMAQEWELPAAMAVAPLVIPDAWTGIALLVVVLSPSCHEVFFPQQ